MSHAWPLLGGLLACAGGAVLVQVLLRDDPEQQRWGLVAVGLLALWWVEGWLVWRTGVAWWTP